MLFPSLFAWKALRNGLVLMGKLQEIWLNCYIFKDHTILWTII